MWRLVARSRREWDDAHARVPEWGQVADQIDMALAASPSPHSMPAWCSACAAVRPMRLSWESAVISNTGVVVPDWSATPTCEGCGLGSGLRALVQHVAEHHRLQEFVELVVGADAAQNWGAVSQALGAGDSAPSDGADWLVVCGLLETAIDPPGLLAQWRGRLALRGRLAVATLFDPSLDETVTSGEDANPHHRFGWDLLALLRSAGFDDAAVHLAWAPWQGHLGSPVCVIGATA